MTPESVTVSLELSGTYDDVVDKLRTPSADAERVSAIAADVAAVLETVRGLDGGTRSAIADALPADLAEPYDAEGVVDVLQLLQRYDLVVLEGNTWQPARSG